MQKFQQMILSDHRGMYIDINANHIFKGEIRAIDNNPQRRVSTKYSKNNKKFRENVSARIAMCGLEKKVDDHLEAILQNKAKNAEETMQKLDQTFHNILIEAEKALPTIPEYAWSEPLHKAYLIVLYWKKKVSY